MWFLYSKFKAKKWKKYTPEKRFVILRELEKKVAKKLDIEPLYLEIKEGGEDWNCFGSFTVYNNTKKIILNPMLIYEPKYRFHAMETIAHETRHAYQFSVANRKLKWYEFRAKKWQRNWSGYFSSGIDNLMYNNQSIERDAQKFSIKFLKKHSEVSDRVIVVDDVNNDTIEDGLNKIMNAPTQNEESQSSFAVPLFIGLIIGILVGAPIGVLLMKRKK